jgi:hypothetical protein
VRQLLAFEYGFAQFGNIDSRRRTDLLCRQLIADIVSLFPNEVSVVRRGARWRANLRMPKGRIISLLMTRSIAGLKTFTRRQIDPVRHERNFMTLLARLDEKNESIFDFRLLPGVDRGSRFRISPNDDWLRRGKRLRTFSEFCYAIKQISTSHGKHRY